MLSLTIGLLVTEVLGAVTLVVSGFLLALIKIVKERRRYLPLFAKGNFETEAIFQNCSAELPKNMRDALPTDEQNLIVYSSFLPFIGEGVDIGGWSFSVALDKPKKDFGTKSQPTNFPLTEIYHTV